jgi:small-conductance mechanosensitive channel
VIELERRRDLGALLRDSFTVYFAHFPTFLALGAVVVVPAELIVSGVGLEQLSSDYDSTPGLAEAAIPAAVAYLVVAPLTTAICVHALLSVASGGSPRARDAIVKGFEAFTPIFFAVLLAALGILLGLILIVPGIYLFVRWYFVPLVVVLEGARDTGALRASGRLVEGAWWRTFAMVLLVNLLALVAAVLLGFPFASAAEGTDRAIWALAGEIVAAMVTQPFGALFATLLYFDLRERKRAAHAG